VRLSLFLIASLAAALPTAAPWRSARAQAAPPTGAELATGGPRVAALRVAVEATGDWAADTLAFPLATTPKPLSPVGGRPSFWKHTGVGLLLGTATGLTAGLYLDGNGSCGMMYCTLLTVPAGALGGTLTGLIVWAIRRAE
jgi:hypothetical protein